MSNGVVVGNAIAQLPALRSLEISTGQEGAARPQGELISREAPLDKWKPICLAVSGLNSATKVQLGCRLGRGPYAAKHEL